MVEAVDLQPVVFSNVQKTLGSRDTADFLREQAFGTYLEAHLAIGEPLSPLVTHILSLIPSKSLSGSWLQLTQLRPNRKLFFHLCSWLMEEAFQCLG